MMNMWERLTAARSGALAIPPRRDLYGKKKHPDPSTRVKRIPCGLIIVRRK
jgi:hypothetical protein